MRPHKARNMHHRLHLMRETSTSMLKCLPLGHLIKASLILTKYLFEHQHITTLRHFHQICRFLFTWTKMSSGLEFDVIVAVCDNGGIGYKGAIPWTLHGDMKHFARLTTETVDPSKRNAVVMGRRTWMGIPEANRPLKNRINVVITNTLTNLTSGPNIYAAGSIEDAMALLSSPPLSQVIA